MARSPNYLLRDGAACDRWIGRSTHSDVATLWYGYADVSLAEEHEFTAEEVRTSAWRYEQRVEYWRIVESDSLCLLNIVSSILPVEWLRRTLTGKDVLSVASLVPTVAPNRHYMLFVRGDLLVLLSNAGTQKKSQTDQVDTAAIPGLISGAANGSSPAHSAEGTNLPYATLTCVKLASLDPRWSHVCSGLTRGSSKFGPCTNVTQPELLQKLHKHGSRAPKVGCTCRVVAGSVEACFDPDEGGEPSIFALDYFQS